MTEQEYLKKMQELRTKRNQHQIEVNRLQKEMDNLESNHKMIDLSINQHIVLDRTSKGGYKYYFYVNEWVKSGRGVSLHGFGFYSTSYSAVQFQDSIPVGWEEVDSIKIIDKDEFINAYKECIQNCNDKFIKHYNTALNNIPVSLSSEVFNTKIPLKTLSKLIIN